MDEKQPEAQEPAKVRVYIALATTDPQAGHYVVGVFSTEEKLQDFAKSRKSAPHWEQVDDFKVWEIDGTEVD